VDSYRSGNTSGCGKHSRTDQKGITSLSNFVILSAESEYCANLGLSNLLWETIHQINPEMVARNYKFIKLSIVKSDSFPLFKTD
jgi:hypothetical protein